jgi:hypothetical protein
MFFRRRHNIIPGSIRSTKPFRSRGKAANEWHAWHHFAVPPRPSLYRSLGACRCSSVPPFARSKFPPYCARDGNREAMLSANTDRKGGRSEVDHLHCSDGEKPPECRPIHSRRMKPWCRRPDDRPCQQHAPARRCASLRFRYSSKKVSCLRWALQEKSPFQVDFVERCGIQRLRRPLRPNKSRQTRIMVSPPCQPAAGGGVESGGCPHRRKDRCEEGGHSESFQRRQHDHKKAIGGGGNREDCPC